MTPDQQQRAIDRVVCPACRPTTVQSDPVDFVEFLLRGVTYRDLDALADDIVCFVLRWDDLCQHVKDRLEALRAFRGVPYPTPAADPRVVAQNIVAALDALERARLAGR